MNRILIFGFAVLSMSLYGVWLEASPADHRASAVQATLAIPAGLTGFAGDTLTVPVFTSTTKSIGQVQIVVEFDGRNFAFITATIGPEVSGFIVSQTILRPAIPIVTAGATENVLVTISGGGTSFFSGNDRNVLLLRFKVAGSVGGTSPFAFNPDSSATFLTTDSLANLSGTDLQFNHGSASIASLATLSIPGGFSVAKTETLQVPVRLSSVRPIGVAQMVLDYDANDLKFIGAQPGPDAAGFAMLSESELTFAPATFGTNKNLLLTLYSGAATLLGENKNVLILTFVAVGEVGGNSPLAFDRRADHTVLSTIELVDLTGADLAFRDGDVTILPPLVNLTGKLLYRSLPAPVPGGIVTISGPVNSTATTDATGAYLFKTILQGSYTLRPSKSGDSRGAIQGSDVLLVLRATALIDTLTADEKISAEVTGDGRITVSDALAILRYLAFQSSGIAQVGIWAFYPEAVTLLVQSDTTQDFKAFLLGDVNGSWAQSPGLAKTSELPFASVKFGELREEGERAYLPLLAGQEGRVFTFLASFALPAGIGSTLNFVPASPHILSVAHWDGTLNWHLALVTIEGVAPGQKIGDFVLPLAAIATLQNWQFKSAEINDWPMKITMAQVNDEVNTIPSDFLLLPNFPNPFNPFTWITFGIPARAAETEVQLDIFAMDGRHVRSLVRGKYAPGTHRILWDGHDAVGAAVPSGVYFYRLQAGGFTASRKLILVR
ncbi:MAG: T9SS type A sorting domain-containing protein [candidate division KSB1 bacterium]|nr:T9SS type A sorting domain-containing protein [candidate division KSB1 bacterium]MDZ7302331.1 T9SS type A sorting domain-containing protein [candidate division KSB1 bacterium]MDZ7311184.1 T9SS type A sorting domain-containing protein [candidate division KSB1 bacterium]